MVPFHSPKGTAGEWLEDPYELEGDTFVGPGESCPLHVKGAKLNLQVIKYHSTLYLLGHEEVMSSRKMQTMSH